MPPMLGSSQVLLNRDHAQTYYSGMPTCTLSGWPLRRHGDEVQRLAGGYYRALGRCDDTMNLGGIKVGSVELERAVLLHVPAVADIAAIGIPTPGGGPERLHLVIVARTEGADPVQLQHACSSAIRTHLNPLFKVEGIRLVPALPRTATNKVLRRELRQELLSQVKAPRRSRL